MKRSLLVLFLTVVVSVPTFAMEIIPKVGYLFSPGLHFKKISYNKASSFSAGADFMFQMGKTGLYIGPGFAWNQKHQVVDVRETKFGFTNIFANAKYKFKAGEVDLYPFFQLGLGISNIDKFNEAEVELENIHARKEKFSGGVYYGIGFGAEYKNIVFELLYSCNFGGYTYEREHWFEGHLMEYEKHTETVTYSAFRIQIGYKFSL